MQDNTRPTLTIATDVERSPIMTSTPTSPANEPNTLKGKKSWNIFSRGRGRSKSVGDLSAGNILLSPFASDEAQHAASTGSSDLNSATVPKSALKSPRYEQQTLGKRVSIDPLILQAEDLSAEPSPTAEASESAPLEPEATAEAQQSAPKGTRNKWFRRASKVQEPAPLEESIAGEALSAESSPIAEASESAPLEPEAAAEVHQPAPEPKRKWYRRASKVREPAPLETPIAGEAGQPLNPSPEQGGNNRDHPVPDDTTPATASPGHEREDPLPEKPKETLRSAFDYTFSRAANIVTAQQMFRDACADHVYPTTSYTRQEFTSLLEEKLIYRPGFASPEFFQVFIRITAFVHQYVDPQLDQVIAELFVTHKKDPQGLFACRVYPRKTMLPTHFNNGMQSVYIAHRDQRSSERIPSPGWYVPIADMIKLTEFNTELLRAAGNRVDTNKRLRNTEVSDLWKKLEQRNSRFKFFFVQ
jgi:hypothetical protein